MGKLSYRAREKDVERFFKGYGKILEVDLKNGYVIFSLLERTECAAEAAIESLRRINCCLFRSIRIKAELQNGLNNPGDELRVKMCLEI